jgi:hypothetical protein
MAQKRQLTTWQEESDAAKGVFLAAVRDVDALVASQMAIFGGITAPNLRSEEFVR